MLNGNRRAYPTQPTGPKPLKRHLHKLIILARARVTSGHAAIAGQGKVILVQVDRISGAGPNVRQKPSRAWATASLRPNPAGDAPWNLLGPLHHRGGRQRTGGSLDH